jgi:hypothetical protein
MTFSVCCNHLQLQRRCAGRPASDWWFVDGITGLHPLVQCCALQLRDPCFYDLMMLCSTCMCVCPSSRVYGCHSGPDQCGGRSRRHHSFNHRGLLPGQHRGTCFDPAPDHRAHFIDTPLIGAGGWLQHHSTTACSSNMAGSK